MKTEFILAARAAFFDDLNFPNVVNVVPYQWLMEKIQSALVIAQREHLEKDADYRQLLPYILLRRITPDARSEYFLYQRTKKVGETRLAGKYSIGLGGHIDAVRIKWKDSVLDLEETILANNVAELNEEVRMDGLTWSAAWQEIDGAENNVSAGIPRPLSLVITHGRDVHRVHAGIVMVVDVPYGSRIEVAESELQTVGWFTAGELAKSDYDLEVWSSVLVNYFHRGTHGGSAAAAGPAPDQPRVAEQR